MSAALLLLLALLWQSEVSGRLLISEIHYVGDKQAETDFVEIVNSSPNASVPLLGVRLSGGVAFTFTANRTLAPGAYLVICQNVAKCTSAFNLAANSAVGPFLGALNSEHDRVRIDVPDKRSLTIRYKYGFPWPAPLRRLESIQLVSVALVDAPEAGSMWRAAPPTPNAACHASVAVSSAGAVPPLVDDAVHLVDFAARSAVVALTVRHGGPVVVTVFFQHVAPGAYIRRTDAAFDTAWTMVTASDDGSGADRVAGDGVYSARCPQAMLVARSVVRWRAQINFAGGVTLWPFRGDVPNWAFFFAPPRTPAYTGAIDPAGDAERAARTTVELADAEPMAVIHVLANEREVWDTLWMYKSTLTEAPPADEYRALATVVIDGDVYDHVRWRCRGQAGRFAAGKNAWKFQFNDGHFARLRQDGARARAVPTQRLETLNLDAMFLNLMSGWQRQYEPIGTHGLPQMMSARLFELAQVPSLWNSLVQLRVVIYANESTTDQYATDFWGLYLAFEEPDGRYLERHSLPDGSLYKVQRPPEPTAIKHRGLGQPNDTSDVLTMLGLLERAQTQQWAYDNLDMPLYYRWRAVSTVIGHLDIGRGKNWLFFRPSAGADRRVRLLPWDFDRTFVNSLVQDDRWNQTLLHPRTQLEFHAALTSFHQLYCNNSGENVRLLDEQRRRLFDDARQHHVIDAERLRWDFAPELERMPNQAHPFQIGPNGERRPAPRGHFYVRANDVPGPLGQQLASNIDTLLSISRSQTTLWTGNFARMVDVYLRRLVLYHCTVLSQVATPKNIQTPPRIAATPTAVNDATAVDQLRFGVAGVAPSASISLEWQLAAVHGPSVPGAAFVAGDKQRYELTPLHTATVPSSQPAPQFSVPIDMSLVGRLLRVRVRAVATNGTASLWSSPLEFTATAPVDAALPLIVSEVMYHAALSSADDYVELYNPSAVERSLRGVRLDGDVQFRFADNDTLASRAALVLARDPAAYRLRYGAAPFNVDRPLNGSLSNGGGTLELKDVSGAVMDRAVFDSRIPLVSVLADGLGFALERTPGASGAATAWHLSPFGGSPGRHDASSAAAAAAAAARSPLVVSEVMAAPADLVSDWVELHNSGSAAIDLEAESWHIADSELRLNATRRRPLRGTIAAGGFMVLSRAELGFGFGSEGDACYVLRLGPNGQPTGVVHGFEFGATPRGLTIGRVETADKREHLGVVLSRPTPGFENAYPAASPLALMAFAIDLSGQRADSRLQHERDVVGARPTRTAYVELASSDDSALLLAGALPSGETVRWCVSGCRYDFCFDGSGGERRGRRVVLSEARTLWFTTTRNMAGVVLAGPAVADGEGLADDDNRNVWTQTAVDPCTSGGADTSVHVERRVSGGFDELRERVDLAALAAAGVGANVSLEERGALRFVRHSAALFAGDLRGWKAAQFATVNGNDAWPRCVGSDVSSCASPSPCVVATACSGGECVYGPKQCAAPSNMCAVAFCSEQAQGCVERVVDFGVADKVAIGLSPLCAIDPQMLAAARCGNGVIEAGELCDGELCCDPTCKAFRPGGFVCRAAPGEASCTSATRCSGTSAACPAAAIAARGTACRPANASRPCDVADVCDGVSGLCPSDSQQPFMTACTPLAALDMCRGDARCTNGGECHALYTCNCTESPTVCDTGDPCWRGECVGGKCARVFSPLGAACNDGDACTIDDACSAVGVCSGVASQCAGNCSGHGKCCASQCLCEPGFKGAQCADKDDVGGVTLPPETTSTMGVGVPDGGFLALFNTPWILYTTIGVGGGVLLICCLAVVCIIVACMRKSKKKKAKERKLERSMRGNTAMQVYDSGVFADDRVAVMTANAPNAPMSGSALFSSAVHEPLQSSMYNSQMHSMQSSQLQNSQLQASQMHSGMFTTVASPTQSGHLTQSTLPVPMPSVFNGGASAPDDFGDLPVVDLDRESTFEAQPAPPEDTMERDSARYY